MKNRVTDRVVLLRRSVHGESDLILTFLGRVHGKFSAYARGARRSKKRFGASLGWFTVADVEISRRAGAEMFTLASADLVKSHAALAIDPATLAHASYATEIVRELSATEQQDVAVFDLLCEFYDVLGNRGASRFALRSFELALLERLGLAPSFDACARCGSTALDRGPILDSHGGGIACETCAASLRGQGNRPLSGAVRQLLSLAAKQADLDAAAGVATEVTFDADDERQAGRAMTAILSRYLNKPLRSLEFIAKMNAAG